MVCKLIIALKVNDRILVPRPKVLGGQPEKGTVTSEPRRGSAPGVWGIDVTYDKPLGLDSTLWRREDTRFELDGETYNLPEFPGMTLLGRIDFSCCSDEFNLTGVWRDSLGELYLADDYYGEWMATAPEPLTQDDLVECTADLLETHLINRLNQAEWMEDRAPYVIEIAKLMDAVRTP